jgi:hypothetical protein
LEIRKLEIGNWKLEINRYALEIKLKMGFKEIVEKTNAPQ